MKQIGTANWQLILPDEWHLEELDDAILITDDDHVSELLVSTLEFSEQPLDKEEVEAFANSITEHDSSGCWLEIADYQAWYYAYSENEDYVREWYIPAENVLLVISYCCALENRQMDDAAINEILDTLIINPIQDSAAGS